MIGSLQNESLFESMFQLTAEGVLVVDNDATILLANPACTNLFGTDSDDLLGKNIEILIGEKNREQLKKHILNSNKTNKNLEVLGVKKDGREFSLEIGLSSTVINGKNLTIIFLRDISNKTENLLQIKQTNNKLTESNRKLDALINNIKGILFRCDNNEDYTMQYMSEGCLDITGYPFDDFKNKIINYVQLILEADRNSVREHIQTAIKQNKKYDCEYRIQHKNGSIKYVWEKGEAVYNIQNKAIALEGFIIDVTVQKETETKLRHNEAKTKALLEAIPDMIFIQDRKGNYLDCYSNSPQKVLWPLEKFIGLNMKDVLPTAVYKKLNASHKEVIASGILQVVEYNVQEKKGIEHYEARVVLMNNQSLLTIVRNITKEKAIGLQLNIKNNALASASNSITIADARRPNLPIIYCNTAFEKITGYTKEEVYGKNCNFLQDDDRDQEAINIMKNAITKGEACNVILRNYKKDGTLFWNDVSITPVRNNKNILTHFIGVQNDVTNKVKAEDLKERIRNILELIAQDRPLKNITKKIIDSVEIHLEDCMGSILLLNKVNKTLNIIDAPNLPKTFCNFIDGAVIGPKTSCCGAASYFKKEVVVTNLETDVLREDYKKIALKNGIKACWAFPIISSNNKVLGTLGIYSLFAREPLDNEKEMLLDMTNLAGIAIEKHNNIIVLEESKKQLELYAQQLEEKVQERTQEVMATVQKLVQTNLHLEDQMLITKQAEKEIINSKAITLEIAKNFPKGFMVVMNKDLQLILAEGEALEELGLKPLIFEGMTPDDVSVFGEERKTRIKQDIIKTLSGNHLSFEVEYKNKFFAVNTAPLFDENNQIINALMVYNDISEQKQIEFKINNALKKEQELNELKSHFVSMASHEFRTPLSAILTSAILINKQNEPGKEVKREKYVLQIEKNVNHLVTILNDFLSLSKLEEGKTQAVKERFDAVHLSKILVNECKVNLKKGQRINFNSPLEHLYVNQDAKLLRHIINNLLSNASKYSKKNTHLDFEITKNHKNVLIQITDQGIGIPEEEQKHLFNRFFRAKNAHNIEGTGLGLNIAKHYTQLMGGTIGFKSKVNVGATFWIKLPMDMENR